MNEERDILMKEFNVYERDILMNEFNVYACIHIRRYVSKVTQGIHSHKMLHPFKYSEFDHMNAYGHFLWTKCCIHSNTANSSIRNDHMHSYTQVRLDSDSATSFT